MSEKAKPHASVQQTRYSNFIFVKADDKFRLLLSNERIAAKEALANLVAELEDEVFLRSYSLVGLKAGMEMMLWLAAQDIESMQKAWARITVTGAGRYLSPCLCLLGSYQSAEAHRKDDSSCKEAFGRHRYLFVHPLSRTHEWYELSSAERQKFLSERQAVLARHHGVQEFMFSSTGLDDQEHIVARESASLEELTAATRELREQRIKMFTRLQTPGLLCVGTDLRDILDTIG